MNTGSTKRRNRNPKRDDWGAARSSPSREPEQASPPRTPEVARPAAEPPPATRADIPERAWLVAAVLILAAAAFLRLYLPELKPMHHDEGVNGFFLTSLVRQGAYKYDPSNYHGPTLYYLSLPVIYAYGFISLLSSGQPVTMEAIREAGLDTTAVRILTALFGVATVWLVLLLRRHVGTVAALAGAALLAVSPGAVYYSRYFIHETLFVFFTLGIVVAALRFYETAGAWHLMLLGLSAGLLFATKETHFVTVITLLLAWLVAWGWARWRWKGGPATPSSGRRRAKPAPRARSGYEEFLSRLGGANNASLYVAGGAFIFIAVNVLFYSSFFTNGKGVSDAVEALNIWGKTGTSDFHKKAVYTYANWLWQEEAPILILAAVGAAVALYGRARNRFAVFAGAWGFGVLAAYSLIPYKTPWLALNFLVPLAVVAGYGVQTLGRLLPAWLAGFVAAAAVGAAAVDWLGDGARLASTATSLGVSTAALQAALVFVLVAALTALGAYLVLDAEARGAVWPRWSAQALVVAALACAVGAFQTWRLNFRHYDDDRYPYVYSHSQRELLDLVRDVEQFAELTGRGQETAVSIASPEYWPLPWYFRRYKGVGYLGSISAQYDPESTPLVIARLSDNPTEDQVAKLRPLLDANYRQVGVYALRPGVRLALFARRGLGE